MCVRASIASYNTYLLQWSKPVVIFAPNARHYYYTRKKIVDTLVGYLLTIGYIQNKDESLAFGKKNGCVFYAIEGWENLSSDSRQRLWIPPFVSECEGGKKLSK